ncbi:hypothetical protein PsorP6_015452 [Peronosclerospora sorghi]|uniref:Uncharacterized protein n=1 Tax=Peronosclerospora sorghi TaxID=230839 RepID=A0ACC0WP49_9STRA|nr:hypothetical protein PsorP6_015452 [Peronosclerospora sorghi]
MGLYRVHEVAGPQVRLVLDGLLEQQTLQQLAMTSTEVTAEVEHRKMINKQREEQMPVLPEQLEMTC